MKHYPATPRTSFPTHWLTTFGWRQAMAVTPRIGKTALMFTIRTLPRGPFNIGLRAGRVEPQDNYSVSLYLGVAELEIDVLRFIERDGREAGE